MSKALDKILKSRGLPTTDEHRELNTIPEFISTGDDKLDALITTNASVYGADPSTNNNLGGIPVNRITEVAGAFGTGKSALMKRIASSLGDQALYIDTEDSLAGEYPFDVIHENIFENIWGVVNDVLDERLYKLIVIDSASVATPLKELDADTDPSMNTNMERAKLFTVWSRQLINKIRGSGCAVVFINHLKTSPDMFGGEKTTGGSAIDYVASLKLYLYSSNSKIKTGIKDGKKVAKGQTVKVKVAKSRFGARNETVDIFLDYSNS